MSVINITCISISTFEGVRLSWYCYGKSEPTILSLSLSLPDPIRDVDVLGSVYLNFCSYPPSPNWSEIGATSIPARSSRTRASKSNQFSHLGHHHHHHPRLQPSLCHAAENGNNPPDVRDNAEPDNPNKKAQRKPIPSTTQIINRLKRYGISGVLSYGLLNTAYYLTAFLLVWFYVAPAPGRMGYWAAVERFVKIMAMVWAGSQVTKIVRAGGALALAPFVDRGLSWFTVKFEFESQGKAFMAIVGFCFGLALLLFFVVTLLWA